MRTRKLWLAFSVLAFLLCPEHLPAQQGSQQSCDVPLVVAGFNTQTRESNQMLLDLHPEDLVVHVGSDEGIVESIKVDGGPKRVALILDPSRNVPDEEWILEAEMAARMVEIARPDDKFLIFLEGIERPQERFLTPEETDRLLRAMTFDRPSTSDSTERAYDTLFDAARRMEPPAFGDALILFGPAEDAGSKIDPDRLLELVLRNRQRLLGFSFRDPRGDPKLDKMSRETGYHFSYDQIEALKGRYQMTLLDGFMSDVYGWIAQPYRLRIRPVPAKDAARLRVEVMNSEGRVPRADTLYYPHTIYPCSDSGSTAQ